MKRVLLSFLVVFCHFLATAQFYLTYSYNFDNADTLTEGWVFDTDDPNSLDVTMGGGVRLAGDAYSAPNVWTFCSLFGENMYQRLISPRLIANGVDSVKVSFKYKVGPGSTESLRVGYCTLNNYTSINDFQWAASTLQTSSEDWQTFSVTVSPFTQYVVLDYLSVQQYFIAIDDIEIEQVTGLAVYPITVSHNAGGIVTPGSCMVNEGDDITFYMIPDEGHNVENVWVDNFRVGNVSQYVFENVSAPHQLEARFRINDYELYITTSGEGSGTITPAGQVFGLLLVPWDTTITFTIDPSPGSYLVDVIVDDTLHLGVAYSYTIPNIRENHTIEAVFSLEDYVVQTLVGANGTMSPQGPLHYHYDDNQIFNIHANTGYWIDTLYVDGVVCDSATHQTDFVYLLDTIRGNHLVSVVFSRISYLITVNTTVGGNVNVAGATPQGQNQYLAYYGDVVRFTITPETGYYTDSLIVNAVSQTQLDEYVINGITDNYDVFAKFAMYQFSIIVNHNDLGNVVHSTAQNINYFDTASFTVTSLSCTSLDSVLLDGERLPSQTSYSFTELVGEHHLDVFFGEVYFECQLVEDTLGFILGEENPLCGTSEIYLIVPEYCYQMNAFYVDGVDHTVDVQDLDGNLAYILNDIEGNHVLQADFQQISYAVTVNNRAGSGSWIAPSEVLCDSTYTISVIPGACNTIYAVAIDEERFDVQAGVLPPHSFLSHDTLHFSIESVSQNHQIELFFGPGILESEIVSSTHGIVTQLFDTLYCGGTASWLLTPDDCYGISAVYVNEVDLTSQLQAEEHGMLLVVENQTQNVLVRAEFAIRDMHIQYYAGDHGTLLASVDSSVACGSGVTFTLIPDACYQVDSVFLNGVPVNDALVFIPSTSSSYTGDTAIYVLDNVVRDCQITATFKAIEYQLQTVSHGLGEVTASLSDSVIACGNAVTYTITPTACSTITEIYYNSALYTGYDINDGIATFTVPAVYENQKVEAYFSIINYAITSETALHGTIAAPAVVDCGDSALVTLTPETCYEVDSIWVDGIVLPNETWQVNNQGVVTFVLTDISDNHHITALFSPILYSVHVACILPLAISPVDTVLVCGATAQFQLVADACHQVDSVIVNGLSYSFAELLQNGNLNRLGNIFYFTFPQITEETSFMVCIHQIVYPLTIAYNQSGGQVNCDQSGVIPCGSDAHFQIEPADCYEITDVLLNGNSVLSQLNWQGNIAHFEITDCHHSANFQVIFAEEYYRVNVAWVDGADTLQSLSSLEHCGASYAFVSHYSDDCYDIDTMLVNGVSVSWDSLQVFNDIRTDISVVISMHQRVYRITVTELSGGPQITPFGRNEVVCGDDFTVTFVPAANYSLQNWIVDGDTLPPTSAYTIEDVHGDHSISAILEGTGYHLHATVGDGGMISPMDAYALAGESVTFNITPDDCFVIDSVWIDGTYSGAGDFYAFDDINADHTIEVKFRQLSYTMILNAGQHGFISLSGSPTVLCGDSRVVTVSPDDCYQVQSLQINGVESSSMLPSLTAPSTIQFDDIVGNYRITVAFVALTYQLTTNAGEGGTIYTDLSTITCGDSALFFIRPDDCHNIDSVFVNGIYRGSDSLLLLENIQENTEVSAVFAQKQYQLATENVAGGTILPAGVSNVLCDSAFQYHFVSDEGYHVTAIIIDGVSYAADSVYTFVNVHSDHTISALFDRNSYTVEVTVEGNGTVLPDTTNQVLYGDSLVLTFVADDCSEVDSIWVDGMYVGSTTNYTLQQISQNMNVRVVLKERSYLIVAHAAVGGTISPDDSTEVICGQDITYNMSPEAGYQLTAIVVDGDTLPANSTYAFTDVRATHTIEALFERNAYVVTTEIVGNGTASVPNVVTVLWGDSLSMEFYPTDCYEVDSVIVNGIYVGNMSAYTLYNITDNQDVRIVFGLLEYEVNVSTIGGGNCSPSGNIAVYCGDSLPITMSADECHSIDSIWVDGLYVGNNNSHTLYDITGNHQVVVSFATDFYQVTTVVTMNGNEVSRNIFAMMCGSDTLVEFPEVACYGVGTLSVNGNVVPAAANYLLTNIHQDYLLEVNLTEQQYWVVAEIQGEGSVMPADTTYVGCGQNLDLTFEAAEGWYLYDVLLDGESIEGVGEQYTLANVSANHVITVIFARNQYIILSSIDPINAGNIIPYGAVMVTGGTDTTFTITPFPSYQISDVVVDGVSVGAISSYTFENINSDHSIEALLSGVGIESPVQQVLHVYAANQSLFIDNTTHQPIQRLTVFDMSGKMVYQRESVNGSMVIPMHVANGIYIVRVQMVGSVITYKVNF